MSKKKDFSDIKTWAKQQGYENMYKEANLTKRLKDLTKTHIPAAIKRKDRGAIAKLKRERGIITSEKKLQEEIIREREAFKLKAMDQRHFNSKDNKHIMS